MISEHHRVLCPAHRQRSGIGHQRGGQGVACLRALNEQLAHVRQVEQPGSLADCSVFVEDAGVLDRHQPAAELDEPRAEAAMDVDEGRLSERFLWQDRLGRLRCLGRRGRHAG